VKPIFELMEALDTYIPLPMRTWTSRF